MRILAAQINQTIGDFSGNVANICRVLERAQKAQLDVVVFPELAICGYFPEDLLLDRDFIDECEKQLPIIQMQTKGLFVVVGLPRRNPEKKEKPLYNSAAVFLDGNLVGFKDKTLLPTYDVFDERRYFEPGKEEPVWEYRGKRIAITICEDVWQHTAKLDEYTNYRRDPILEWKEKKADLVLNLSASPYYFQREKTRLTVFQAVAQTLQCPVVFCNQVGANDQLVFDGHSFALGCSGQLVACAQGFVEQDLLIDSGESTPCLPTWNQEIKNLYQALVLGVRDYFHKQGFQKALVGLSGGIDSALVACIAAEALGASNVLALTLPSRFSSKGSVDDSIELAKRLGIKLHEVGIEPIFETYLQLLDPFFTGYSFNETEENLQTRIRGMILMAFSNKLGHVVLNTSNKSEMAMGYCTLYGDMAGGLGVLQDVTKLQVYSLANYVQIIPDSILQKVPSAELRENQTDFDTLPPFETLDPILEDYMEKRLTPLEIATSRHLPLPLVETIIRKIHLAEYKRRQAPIGIRVTAKAFSKGRIVPIVQGWKR